jgi:hypothetical protein
MNAMEADNLGIACKDHLLNLASVINEHNVDLLRTHHGLRLCGRGVHVS